MSSISEKAIFYKVSCLCSLVLLTDSFTHFFVASFFPEMILWLGYTEHQKGYYMGLLEVAYCISVAVFSLLWGWVSDIIESKKLLVILLVGSSLTSMLTGFCSSFLSVLLVRLFQGAINSQFVLVNSVLCHFTTDNTQALAVSIAITGFGIGLSIGPFLAGLMAAPAEKYPSVFSSFGLFGLYPYLLPCLIASILCLFVSISVILFLPSTTGFYNNEILIQPESSQYSLRLYSVSNLDSNNEDKYEKTEPEPDTKPSLHTNVDKCITNSEKSKLLNESMNKGVYLKLMDIFKNSKIVKLLTKPTIVKVLIFVAIYYFTFMGSVFLIPLWLSTSRELGGMEFSSTYIGLFFGLLTFVGLIIQIASLSKIENKFGAIRTFTIFGVVLTILFSITALVRFLPQNWILWLVLTIDITALMTCIVSTRGLTLIFINNSVPDSHVGTMNGLASGVSHVTGTISPMLGGYIFSESVVSSRGPPFDTSFVFVFYGVFIFVCCCICLMLPQSLNKQNQHSL